MSALPPFPFPQGAGAAPATQGGVKIGPGQYTFRPSVPGELIQGLSGFVNSFIQARQVSKQNAMDKANSLIAQRIQGIPVPDEEIAKAYKQAGYKLPIHSEKDMENYNAQKQVYDQNQQAMQSMMTASQQPGMAGAVAGQVAQNMPPSGPPPTMGVSMPPQPGFFGRLGNAMGFGAPSQAQMGPGSPMAQYLQNIDQAARVGGGLPGQLARGGGMANMGYNLAELQLHGAKMDQWFKDNYGMPFDMLSVSQKSNIIGTLNAALNGDEGARERAIKNNLLNGVPLDEASMLTSALSGKPFAQSKKEAAELLFYKEMGGPQMRLAMQQMGGKFFEDGRVDSLADGMKLAFNPFDPTVQTHVSPQQYNQMADGMDKFLKVFPDPTLAQKYGAGIYAYGSPNNPWSNAAVGVGQQHITKTIPAAEAAARTSEAASSALNAHTRVGELGLRTEIDRGRLNLDLASEIAKQAGEAGDTWLKLWSDPKSSLQQRAAAGAGIASAMSNKAKIAVKLGDRTFTMGQKAISDWTDWAHKGGVWGSEPMIRLSEGYDVGPEMEMKSLDDVARENAAKRMGMDPKQMTQPGWMNMMQGFTPIMPFQP